MSSATFRNSVAKALECKLCLHVLDNPKLLSCMHPFCKDCLDDSLNFKNDGSATIRCPLGCHCSDVIGSQNTSNILKVPLMLSSLLDVVGLDEDDDNDTIGKHKPPCNGSIGCTQNGSYHCVHCSKTFCSSCKANHTHNKEDVTNYIPIKYHRNSQTTYPWCTQHDAYAKYTCEGSFICVYCKARQYKTHICQPLNNIHQEIISDRQTSTRKLVDDMRRCSEDYIRTVRYELINNITNRKINCIIEKWNELTSEEERIIGDFDDRVIQHFSLYPDPCHLTSHEPDKPFYETYLDKLYHRNHTNISFPNERLKLSNKGKDGDSLGELVVETMNDITVVTSTYSAHAHSQSNTMTSLTADILDTELDTEGVSSMMKCINGTLHIAIDEENKVNKVEKMHEDDTSSVPTQEDNGTSEILVAVSSRRGSRVDLISGDYPMDHRESGSTDSESYISDHDVKTYDEKTKGDTMTFSNIEDTEIFRTSNVLSKSKGCKPYSEMMKRIPLSKEGFAFGFGVVGGRRSGIIVSSILPDGVAGRDGNMKVGDRIVAINDESLQGMNKRQLRDIVTEAGRHVVFVVSRDANFMKKESSV